MRGRFMGLLLGLIAVSLASCGSGSGLDLGRVQGRVMHDGEPIRNGTVVFEADESKGTVGPSGMGIIDKDGNYVLTTSESGDGALVGFHRVGIVGLETDPISTEDGGPPPDPSEDSLGYLKGKAASAQKSNRTKRGTDKSDVETFTDRGGRTFRYVIFKSFGAPEDSGIAVEVQRGSNTFNFDVRKDGRVLVSQ